MDRSNEALQGAMAAFSEILLSKETIDTTNQLVVNLAKQTIPSCDGAGMTLAEGSGFRTGASTDAFVLRVDAVQYQLDDGPCLRAIRSNRLINFDAVQDNRWIDFAKGAREQGVLSCLSVPLTAEGHPLGALNLYSFLSNGFDEADEEMGALFAAPASTALANVRLHAQDVELSTQLETALKSRAVIDQAKGILIATRKCTPETAFEYLRVASQQSNIKLRDLAQEIVAKFSNAAIE